VSTVDKPSQQEKAEVQLTFQVDHLSVFEDKAITDPRELNNLTSALRDTLPLRRIDHVRFFVGNARQSAYFYRNAFGFDVIAYAGLETKTKHEAAYVLRQGDVTFVLASPLSVKDF